MRIGKIRAMAARVNVHLIDGTYELFRSYYGAPPAKAPAGQEVGAVRGLLTSLASLLRQVDVTHVAIAFDTVIESFRNQLFDGYKTGEGMDPLLWAQFPLAERAAKALGIVVWPMVEFEADDGLAAGAARFGDDPGVERVLLCTPDKDLAQMVRDDRIVQFDRMRRVVFDEAAVRAKFGVSPASIPDYLALVGDPQDGIPGVPRWGAKSTAAVLAHYGQLAAIPLDASQWQVKVRAADALAQTLAEHRDRAELYRTLATLRTDVPIEEGLADLQWRGPAAELSALCREIGFERFLERFDGAADQSSD